MSDVRANWPVCLHTFRWAVPSAWFGSSWTWPTDDKGKQPQWSRWQGSQELRTRRNRSVLQLMFCSHRNSSKCNTVSFKWHMVYILYYLFILFMYFLIFLFSLFCLSNLFALLHLLYFIYVIHFNNLILFSLFINLYYLHIIADTVISNC